MACMVRGWRGRTLANRYDPYSGRLRYDGYFENVADRILAVLTEDTRHAILNLKYETPETEKIMGIEYYQAVIQAGVRTYAEFEEWRKLHPVTGVVEWLP